MSIISKVREFFADATPSAGGGHLAPRPTGKYMRLSLIHN